MTDGQSGENWVKISDEKDLDEAKHPHEISKGIKFIRFDYAHQGLGSKLVIRMSL
jgi:hypothetical protein